MNAGDILERLEQLSPDRIMTAAGLALALLLVLALWLAVRRRNAKRSIGLTRIAAALPEGSGPVTRAAPSFSPPDPLEDDNGEEKAEFIEEIQRTCYTERVNVPLSERRSEAGTVRGLEPAPDVLEPAPAPESEPLRRPPLFATAARAPDTPEAPSAPSMPEWEFLKTLPFVVRRGLSTGHADMLGIGIEAVFFAPETINRLGDPVLRLAPFLPEDEGELLCRESDRRTFQAGGLYAQPDAVIALKSGGVLAVEYKSRGGRLDDAGDIPGSLRPKDLLQTVIGAMVLSASEGVACAPVLRTNNAVYFLRPGRALASLLAERIAAADAFVKPYAERSGVSASDYAELCVVPARMLAGKSAPSAGSLLGEAAHARMLR